MGMKGIAIKSTRPYRHLALKDRQVSCLLQELAGVRFLRKKV
jgi:hypothetical protein